MILVISNVRFYLTTSPISINETERELLGIFRMLSETDKDLMVKLIRRFGRHTELIMAENRQ